TSYFQAPQSYVPASQQYQPPQPVQPLNPRQSSGGYSFTPSALGQSGGQSSPVPQVNTTLSPALLPSNGPAAVLAPSMLSKSDRGLHQGRMSSDDGRVHQSQSLNHHLRAASLSQAGLGSGSGRMPSPLGINNSEIKKPLTTKSEDWGALVDAPDSPTQLFHSGSRFQGQPFAGQGYTDSPTEEPVHSVDYMHHISQQRPGPRHAQSDPPPGQHRQGFHQQHNSVSSLSLSFTGNLGPGDLNHSSSMAVPGGRQHRLSWSPNTQYSLEAPMPLHSNSSEFRTPPRRLDGSPSAVLGLRSGSHSKQNSVATSISLLSDTAIVAKYSEAATKTNDPALQLSYAKYLLEIGEPSETFIPMPEQGTTANGSPTGTPPSVSFSPTIGQEKNPEKMGKRQLTQEAINWIDKLSKEGQAEAQFIRGTWNEDGLYGTKKNADKALKHYQSASKGDFAPAHFKFGSLCEKKKDNNKAVVLYKKAATHNDVPSNYRLAIVYLYGELGQSKNLKTGLQYLKRAATFATVDSPMPPHVLGLILAREYTQLSIPDDVAFPDDGEAFEWFKKSAELGYGPANFKLGYCYEYGTLGCKVDPYPSIEHYERAVLAGDSNGEAEMALSGWYISGAENCFESDDALAFQYASKAAEKKLPKAQYAMGYYYEVGISVQTDMNMAMEYYKQAAAGGSKEAQARLSGRSTFDKSGHRRSIKRINQNRAAKDNNCILM
ncbi:hypothetical protein BGZ65_003295, partial [Modicella reniformis]